MEKIKPKRNYQPTRSLIEQWTRFNKIKKYTIHDDLSITVHESARLQKNYGSGYPWESGFLPVNLRAVEGDLYIDNMSLYSLEGCPQTVKGNFSCCYNNLETLEFSPLSVQKNYDCSHNKLSVLIGAPSVIHWNFHCAYQGKSLKNLLGAPEKIQGNFDASNNTLTSLEGAPKEIKKNFNLANNSLSNLLFSPENVGNHMVVRFNRLHSLEGAPKHIGGDFDCSHNPNLSRLIGFAENFGSTSQFIAENTNFLELIKLKKAHNLKYPKNGLAKEKDFIVAGAEIIAILQKQKLLANLKVSIFESPKKTKTKIKI